MYNHIQNRLYNRQIYIILQNVYIYIYVCIYIYMCVCVCDIGNTEQRH